MSQLHYFLAPVEIFYEDKLNVVLPSAMISQRSISRAFMETNDVHRDFLNARIFYIKVEEQFLRARLVREQGKDGVHYNMRILEMSMEQNFHFLRMIALRGIPSPWSREYPRIPVSQNTLNTDKPVSIVMHRVAGKTIGRVLNFSYRGLMFEFQSTGISLSEYVGKQVHFNILTKKGVVLGEIEAEVVRIYDEMTSPGRLTRGLGVKFLKFPESSREHYDNLILDVCNEIKNGKA